MSDCSHPVRKYDEQGRPYCDCCGASLIEDGYKRLPFGGWSDA